MPEQPTIYLKLMEDLILPNCRAGATETSLWLYFVDMSFSDVVSLVMQSELFSEIEFHFGSLYNAYEDYTTVKGIFDRGKMIEVMLTGGHVVVEDAKYERDVASDGSDVLSGGEGSGS